MPLTYLAMLRPSLQTIIFAFSLVVAGAFAYMPGLDGPFTFDDWASLPALGTSGPLHDGSSLLRYLTSGTADPTGRPLALASFALNAQDWPAAPFPFKLTNLAIHLANTVLLACLLTRLSRLSGVRPDRVPTVAWLSAALWSLHPFLVSTVLYVVQREAMLAATFALLALMAWLHSREAFASGRRHAAAWLYLGMGGATALALLCKANGVVIPLLALVLESTLPPLSEDAAPRYRRHARTALALPSLLLLGSLTWLAVASIPQPPLAVRGWTIGERLMTEPAVLLDYLARLWLMLPAGGAFFHDQLSVVHSLLDPWHSGLPLVACTLTISAAIMLRRRYPLGSAAILFFFAGHVLESTSVPLELYFEHRNYLPAMLMFWPLSALIINSRYPWLRYGLPALLLGGMFWLTRSQASLWGHPIAQAAVWAELQPKSPRAQAYAASVDLATGRISSAKRRIDAARQYFPYEPQIAINLLNIHCAAGDLTSTDIAYASDAFRRAPRDPGAMMTHWFEAAISNLPQPACVGLDATSLKSLLSSAWLNPRISSLPGRRQDIDHLLGTIALAEKDPDTAAMWFTKALTEEPAAKVALNEAALLGSAGRPDLALKHLDLLDRLPAEPTPSTRNGMAWIHYQILRHQHYWPTEMAHLRRALRATAAPRPAPGARDSAPEGSSQTLLPP